MKSVAKNGVENMNLPEIQTIIDKLAHKKFFIALAFVVLVLRREVVTQYELIAATLIALSAIVCQTWLDSRTDAPEVRIDQIEAAGSPAEPIPVDTGRPIDWYSKENTSK